MSRTRLLRPGFFTDEDVAKLSRESRLAYAGLWTLCDDAGYFERKPRQIAVALFPYDIDRDAVVEAALGELVLLKKVDVLGCGIHAIVPSLPKHAAKGGNKAETFRLRHLADCAGVAVRTPDEQVRTSPDDAPSRPPAGVVRTSPDESPSVSVSDSVSGQRREKNVLERTVVVGAERGARAVEPAPSISVPPEPSRSSASAAVSAPRRVTSPILATARPLQGWRHPCLDYVHHQSKHRIVAGQAVCDVCEAVLAAAAAGPDPVAADGLGL